MVASTGSCVGTPTFSKQVDRKRLYATSFVPPNDDQNVPQNVEVKKPAYTSSIQALMLRPGRAQGAISSTIKWDGSTTTFDVYKTNVESHLLQTGAGYILQEEFQREYCIYGEPYLQEERFCTQYCVSPAQALMDREHLYGALQSSL